jgi:predicted negative regulator of RcsB-dependent stress response
LVDLGKLLNAAGETDRAVAAWRRAVERDHPIWSSAAARLLGRLLVATPQTTAAGLNYYRQAMNSVGASPDVAREVGDVLLRLGETDEARAVLRRLAARP